MDDSKWRMISQTCKRSNKNVHKSYYKSDKNYILETINKVL